MCSYDMSPIHYYDASMTLLENMLGQSMLAHNGFTLCPNPNGYLVSGALGWGLPAAAVFVIAPLVYRRFPKSALILCALMWLGSSAIAARAGINRMATLEYLGRGAEAWAAIPLQIASNTLFFMILPCAAIWLARRSIANLSKAVRARRPG